MIDLAMVVGILILIVSIIDFFIKKVPSALLTGMLFLVAIVNMTEVTFGMIHLSFGIIAFIFAWMVYEAKFIGGVADLKIIALLGMMVNSIPTFFIMIGLVMLLGFLYKLFCRFILKKEDKEEVAFLPVLFVVYLILYIGGGVI